MAKPMITIANSTGDMPSSTASIRAMRWWRRGDSNSGLCGYESYRLAFPAISGYEFTRFSSPLIWLQVFGDGWRLDCRLDRSHKMYLAQRKSTAAAHGFGPGASSVAT